MFCGSLHEREGICLQIFRQILKPCRAKAALCQQLAIFIDCDLDEAVVVVEEHRFIAVGEDGGEVRPALGEPVPHDVAGDVMSAVGHAVGDSPQFSGSQAHPRVVLNSYQNRFIDAFVCK